MHKISLGQQWVASRVVQWSGPHGSGNIRQMSGRAHSGSRPSSHWSHEQLLPSCAVCGAGQRTVELRWNGCGAGTVCTQSFLARSVPPQQKPQQPLMTGDRVAICRSNRFPLTVGWCAARHSAYSRRGRQLRYAPCGVSLPWTTPPRWRRRRCRCQWHGRPSPPPSASSRCVCSSPHSPHAAHRAPTSSGRETH